MPISGDNSVNMSQGALQVWVPHFPVGEFSRTDGVDVLVPPPVQDTEDSAQLSSTSLKGSEERNPQDPPKTFEKIEISQEEKKKASPDSLVMAVEQCNKEGAAPGKISATPTGALLMEDESCQSSPSSMAPEAHRGSHGPPLQKAGEKTSSQGSHGLRDAGQNKLDPAIGQKKIEAGGLRPSQEVERLTRELKACRDRCLVAQKNLEDTESEIASLIFKRDWVNPGENEDPDARKASLDAQIAELEKVRDARQKEYNRLLAEEQRLEAELRAAIDKLSIAQGGPMQSEAV